MAEIVVGPVIDKLIRLLLEEAKLLKGVHGAVQSLTDEQENIKCFLKDAESRAEKEVTNGGLKIWVKQVRDEANHIEDVIDEYLHCVTRRHHHHQSRFSGFLQKIGLLIKQWKASRDLPSKVEDIKTLLSEIKQREVKDMTSEKIPQRKDLITKPRKLNIMTLDWILLETLQLLLLDLGISIIQHAETTQIYDQTDFHRCRR